MVFSSLIFLFIFLPAVLILHYIVPSVGKNFIILISSVIFYAWGEPQYIYLILISILINYFGGLLIRKNHKDEEKHKFIFITLIIINLSILLFFKYYGFLIENINNLLGVSLHIRNLPLPLGISFFTFQLISYVADVYTERVKPQKNIIDFGAYILMFPQLVAGPIIQYSDVEKQLKNRKKSLDKFGEGARRFIIGLGKKVIIANNVSIIWTEVKNLPLENISIVSAWLGIGAFTLQIYFDFSGYSDMAVGLGKMFGFDFIENFNFPYTSKSVTEFWRRWNISLGSWFREYMYIPLGGNRSGLVIQFRNLMIVWFATGLWHGASWNFIFWGLYFGLIIFAEKIFLGNILKRIPDVFNHMYTMVIVIVGWVFFDTDSISSAIGYIGVMFGFGNNLFINNMDKYIVYTNFLILAVAIIACTQLSIKSNKKINVNFKKMDLKLIIVIQTLILIVSIAFLVSESYNPFLYFRF
ncbi:MBOAT family protein [Clostridium gasigenes]|uniref:MBOAT family O-acyltransferase n=1 Tax=Clostridium gasigenes TaxID=94869 RepID=UPI001C0E812D|nr:MBOAT family O-acyltransferase [Clostridium gasigenes]MBU3135244.1 MBOAT family protein [Clostridium gasigenes]